VQGKILRIMELEALSITWAPRTLRKAEEMSPSEKQSMSVMKAKSFKRISSTEQTQSEQKVLENKVSTTMIPSS